MPTNFTYNPNIPAANDSPSNDQPLMQTNTNSINSIIGIDHYSFEQGSGTTGSDGYHTIVHQDAGNPNTRSRSGDGTVFTNFPAAITGINQLFAANYTPNFSGAGTDTQLFSLTGLNGLSQLTGNNASQQGWAWIGGLLLMWGSVTSGGPGSTIVFSAASASSIPFPNNCFTVYAVPWFAAAPGLIGASSVIIINDGATSPTKTQFKWRYVISGGSFNPQGFFWVAIGN